MSHSKCTEMYAGVVQGCLHLLHMQRRTDR